MAIRVVRTPNAIESARLVAARMAAVFRARLDAGASPVWIASTGKSPTLTYAELVQLNRGGHLDFSRIRSFNQDEYYGLARAHPESFWTFMWRHLFAHVGAKLENVHVPPGDVPADRVQLACEDYERALEAAGEIDLALLGIGRNGHIGFNEPGTPRTLGTHFATLHPMTREDATATFAQHNEPVPTHAITIGPRNILQTKTILVVVNGAAKAGIVKEVLEGDLNPRITASYLQTHGDVTVYLDPEAASRLK